MLIGIAAAVVLLLGPLALGLTGVLRAKRSPAIPWVRKSPRWHWTLTATSALLYAFTFNLTFFVQELFLALPKALLPGVHATLFHNDHSWDGEHPLTRLCQGTGALAILISGAVCAYLVQRRPPATWVARLLLIWMAYNGLLQALPQVIVGALNPRNDVGMAMAYLGLSPAGKTLAALLALVAIPAVALMLTRPLLELADSPARLGGAGARSAFMLRIGTLPPLIGVLLIIPFRVPRELIEVLAPPVVVAVIGVAWMQGGAWCVRDVTPARVAPAGSLLYASGALVGLLLLFQLVLRPGIRL
jgi:hypothetical protein